MPLGAKISLTLTAKPDMRQVVLELDSGSLYNTFPESSRYITLSSDMLYDRVQEHLNSTLRILTNNLTQQMKKEKQNVR